MSKLIITYGGSNAVIDAECESEALRVIKKFNVECKPNNLNWEASYGSGLVITYLRLMILRKLIKPEEMEFRFGNDVMLCDDHGMLDWHPQGFDPASKSEVMSEMLDLRLAMFKTVETEVK